MPTVGGAPGEMAENQRKTGGNSAEVGGNPQIARQAAAQPIGCPARERAAGLSAGKVSI